MNIAKVDSEGVATNEHITISLSQQIRRSGDADARITEMLSKAGFKCTGYAIA